MTGSPLARAASISDFMYSRATQASSPQEVRQRLIDSRIGSGCSPQNAQLTSMTSSAGRFPNPARAPNPPAANTALSRSVKNLFQIGSLIEIAPSHIVPSCITAPVDPGSVARAGQHMAATGLVRPIFPGAPGLGRIGAVAAVAGIDLTLREVLDAAVYLPRPQQRAGVARQINGHPHDLDQRSPGRGEAVATHQGHVVAAQAFGEIAALFHIGDEQVGVAEIVGDVPDRHLGSDKAS